MKKNINRIDNWIPVSERLPEKSDVYFATFLEEGKRYVERFYYSNLLGWVMPVAWQDEVRIENIIAWQPLPEPYKGKVMIDGDTTKGFFDIREGSLLEALGDLDEPEQPKVTLQGVIDRLWELSPHDRKPWLARLNDEFQEGYIVPLGLKTTDGQEQYLTYNGSYFASRRNKYLQQTFDTLEEIPEFYRGLAERVL